MIATKMEQELQIPENFALRERVVQYLSQVGKDALMKKKKIAEEMDIHDAENLLALYQKNAPIPNELSILEVAEILDVSKERALEMAESGEITGERRMNRRGSWKFNTIDFVNLPRFINYFEKRLNAKTDSLNLTTAILEDIEDIEKSEEN